MKILDIDIRGEKYRFYKVDIIDDSNTLGTTNVKDKIIQIKQTDDEYSLKNTIIHEMLHALFFESVRLDDCYDEDLINFLAYNFEYLFLKYSQVVSKFIEKEKE